MSSPHHFKSHSKRGFTLIELMVTIAIIAIMTAIVIIKYGSFNSSALLKSQAYEMALNLREAQTFAVSVRSANDSASREGYGIYFATDTPNQYWLFADSNRSGYMDSGEAVGQSFTIDPRFRIQTLRHGTCSSGSSVGRVDVVFRRPDFDANIYGGSTYACITIVSVADSSATRSVEVSATGQITVK